MSEVSNGLNQEPGLVKLTDVPSGDNTPQNSKGSLKRHPSVGWGVAWMVVGMLCVLVQPTLGYIAGAYGASVLVSDGKRGSRVLYALLTVCVPVVALIDFAFDGWRGGVDVLVNSLLMAIVVLCVSKAMAGGRASSRICLVALVASCAYLAIAEMEAVLAGTTMAQTVDGVVQQLQSIETTISNRAQLGTAISAVNQFWPMVFVMLAFTWVAAAYVGARLGLRKVDEGSLFSHFEVPLWCVGLLLAGVVALIAARIFPWWASQLTLVGANMAMTVRIALTVQGLALLSWFMQRHHVVGIVQAVVFLAAASLEVSFFVMSVMGLVDVWANFRNLPHGGKPVGTEVSK